MKYTADYTFRNWAGNQRSTAKRYYQPETGEELQAIIAQSEKVRLVGTGHSWSPVCLSSEALVNLDRYSRIVSLDKERLQLQVQPGIKLWQLNQWLDTQGLALQNLGSISRQSLAGAISTGTHGTGITFPILGAQVQSFTLLNGLGEKHHLHAEDDRVLFDTALVHVGALGVVTDITLQVVPAYRLREQSYVAPLNEVIEQLDDYVQHNDHFKLWWFPHTEKVVVYRYTRTDEPVNDTRWRQWWMDEVLSVGVYRLLLQLGHLHRDWRQGINRLLVHKFIRPLDRIEKSYKVFNVPEPPVHREVEWAFDLQVAKALLREYTQLINTSAHRLNFIQEIRFTRADTYALSPSYGRPSMWLGAYNADNRGWEALKSDFERMARHYGGRPHWGKEFTPDPAYLRQVYPQWSNFVQLRQQWDPQQKFVNDFIARIFL